MTTTRASPFRGHCYTELDNFGEGDLELMSTSTDGGLTWSTPIPTAGHDKGLGGQPVVQPNGTVIVPFESLNGKIEAFTSTDGGASWTKGVDGASVRFHAVAGGPAHQPAAQRRDRRRRQGLRGVGGLPLPGAAAPPTTSCSRTSTDGVTWTAAARIPIDPVTSGVDHFIPGLAVDPATSGASAHLR